MYWVNGFPQQAIDLSDRSFQYGDGCFTTMLTVQGAIEHFGYHKQRVDECLDALGIERPNWPQIEVWLKEASIKVGIAGLKLHISRGEGGRGYSSTQVSSSNVTISSFTYPAHYHQIRANGLKLGSCKQRLGLSPMLAGHKHNNRLEQVLLKAEMDQAGELDGLAFDINGHIIETTMANLFWVKDGELFTPDLSLSGVAGVMRRLVLDVTKLEHIPVHIGNFTVEAIEQADEVFISNSILGIAPIVSIPTKQYAVGPLTKSLQGKLNS